MARIRIERGEIDFAHRVLAPACDRHNVVMLQHFKDGRACATSSHTAANQEE